MIWKCRPLLNVGFKSVAFRIEAFRGSISNTGSKINRTSYEILGAIRYSNFSQNASDRVVKEHKINLDNPKKLFFDVPCDLKIKPIDSHSDPNIVVVRVIRPERNNFRVDLHESEDCMKMIGCLDSTTDMGFRVISMEVEVPFYHDLSVTSKNGNVFVSSLKSSNLEVQVMNGNIKCKNLHCESMHLSCFPGNIDCEGVLQGNIDIKIKGSGNVNGFNFQGGYLRIETENGDIFISCSYSDRSMFVAGEGNIVLKNLHRKSSISQQKGNLTISGLDGSLVARLTEGNIKLQVSRLEEDSYVQTKKGNVILSLTEEDLCQVNLTGREIILKDSMESIGKLTVSGVQSVFQSHLERNLNKATMKVVSDNGEVHLKKETWISALFSEREIGL